MIENKMWKMFPGVVGPSVSVTAPPAAGPRLLSSNQVEPGTSEGPSNPDQGTDQGGLIQMLLKGSC